MYRVQNNEDYSNFVFVKMIKLIIVGFIRFFIINSQIKINLSTLNIIS